MEGLCYGGSHHRRRRDYAMINLTAGQTNAIQLSIPNFMGCIGFELMGYQFSGVQVIAGVPYSQAFYVAIEGPSFCTDQLVSNNGTPTAGVTGIPLPLTGAFTTQQYDTPRLFSHRIGQPSLPGNGFIQVVIRDDSGNEAVFSTGRLYCNLVYGFDTTDITIGVDANHRQIFAEHAGSVKRRRISHE